MNSYEKKTVNPTGIKVSSRPQDWLQRTPSATAIMSKLVQDAVHRTTTPGNGVDVPDPTIFDRLVSRRARKNLDAETIISLAPDIKLIKQMIVSTTLSPVDMTQGELGFKTEASEIPPSVLNQVTEVIRDHFESYYPLRDKLPEIIGEALFETGAWVGVIVPEAVIDDIINLREVGSYLATESFNEKLKTHFVDGTLKSVGILGDPGITDQEIRDANKGKKNIRSSAPAPSLESMFSMPVMNPNQVRINDSATITDNLGIMGLSHIRNQINEERLRNKYRYGRSGAGMEAYRSRNGHNNVSTVARTLYNSRSGQTSVNPVKVIPAASEASRSSIGHPLVIKCPSESVIPCYPKGDERNHIGYVIVLDELGNPINLTDELNQAATNGQIGTMGAQQQLDMTSSLIQQTRIAQNGICMDTDKMAAEERIRVYNQVLEENILNRIKNGLIGRNVKMAWNEDIMRIMMFRQFANQRTNLVFVPAEQVAYFAYDYDSNGMGKSLLDDIKQVSALRAMTTFANFMAGVKNAVGRTKVTMNIDPRTPDPEKAYAILIDEYQRMTSTVTPTDVSSSAEMFRVLRMMGTTIEVQGNPRIPNTTVDINEYQSQKQIIDENFTNDLRRQQYMGLFVTPAMVDMTDEADFAITRWTSNQLYAKRIMMIQDDTCKHGKKLVRSYVNSDGVLIGRIQKIFAENNDKLPEEYRLDKESQIPEDLKYLDAIDAYFDAFYLELPRPENNRIEKQKEEFDKVKDMIDDIVDCYISSELLGAFAPEDQSKIDMLRAHMTAYLKRDWLQSQGFDMGFVKILSPVTEEDPSLDMIKVFTTDIVNMLHNFGDFSSALAATRDALLKRMEVENPKQHEILTANNDAGGGWDNGSSGNDWDNNDSGGGDAFGGGDFGSFEDTEEDPFATDELEGGGETSTEEEADPFATPEETNGPE
ncbi:virion structural protein [Klebsiella phage KpLz-2_45]|uniref:virion structural protein n=1 Tax=Klebsiella phage KpLz-2_45 TaxID=2698923 RepID=UPI001F12BD35|nr:virion structural protein [Klebsiella phage KpLz-2_45]UKS72023.1 virion structural protein [Klebsiella phage KpLz-2_45]